MTTVGDNPICKSCSTTKVPGESEGEWKCPNCGRQDCIVKVNCVNVKAVPLSLRGGISPIHKAFLEIIEEHGENGQIASPRMIEELKKRGFGVGNG